VTTHSESKELTLSSQRSLSSSLLSSPHWLSKALTAINTNDWEKAASLLNTILRKIYEQRDMIDRKRVSQLKAEPRVDRGVPPSPRWMQYASIALRDLMMAATASAAISFLLFSFFGALFSRFKINNR
jgi:hypothetical protein